jgi:hypothetical protein
MLLTEKQSNAIILMNILPVFNKDIIKIILTFKKQLEEEDIRKYYKSCEKRMSKKTYQLKYPIKNRAIMCCFSKQIDVNQSYPHNKTDDSPLFSMIRCFYPGYFKQIKVIPNNDGIPCRKYFHMTIYEKIQALNNFDNRFSGIHKYIEHYSLLYVHQKKWILQIQKVPHFNIRAICLCFLKGDIITKWNHNL